MYVKVCYQDKYDPNVYSMQAYAYVTLHPLKIGDLVIAPTKHGDRVARVFETDVPKSSGFTRYELKYITEYFEESGD